MVAYFIASKELANIVLLDIIEDMPKGKSLDIAQTGVIEKYKTKILGTNSFEDIKNSDIIVITAGAVRKPGMSREDLLKTNTKIIKNISEKIKIFSPDSIIIIVTNPVDVMCYILWKLTGINERKVLGQSGILDSARFAYFVSEKLGISPQDVSAMVLGGHGDSMVPLPRLTTVSGIPLYQLLLETEINEIVERTKNCGAEIVKLLKEGSAYYAPASATVQMVETIITDKKRILPCSVKLNGEYEIYDVFVGVPVILGKDGVEKIVQLDLTEKESELLKKSAEIYKKHINEALQILGKENGI
jgi:malate dehydrogenase